MNWMQIYFMFKVCVPAGVFLILGIWVLYLMFHNIKNSKKKTEKEKYKENWRP